MPKRAEAERVADVCLIVEGAYPFVAGGVSAWTHGLIEAQNHLRFALLAISPDASPRRQAYELPPNVVCFKNISLHNKATRKTPLEIKTAKQTISAILAFQRDGRLERLAEVLRLIKPYTGRAEAADYLDCEAVWSAMEDMARREMPETSFLHYFWSLRSLLNAYLSVMLAPLPPAGVYHAVSTGYAGLIAARARLERSRPALLTEHGIYTNERRIEIAAADWLYDRSAASLTLDPEHRTLKDVWTDCFTAYSRAAYAASERIVTLFRGNQEMQIRDGAPPEKCLVVPNGIDCARYGKLKRAELNAPPVIALIGRVVPIKDVKTYLRAVALLRERFVDLEALVIGPTDENPDYFAQCEQLTRELRLEKTIRFTGRVELEKFLPRIHVAVLTSLSEAQPLVVLEAAAAGVPTVTTDVGACREMIYGDESESPPIGAAGAVTPIGDAQATADAVGRLLEDRAALAQCAGAALERANHYYSKARMDGAYRELYVRLAALGVPAASQQGEQKLPARPRKQPAARSA